MPKVILKNVVERIKDKVDKDNTDLEYYIGGEHFDNGEIQISRKGIIAGSTIGPAFHTRFMPGDVLLMSRNPHLRKASVVDFEGICSDVSYVCRTKDESVLMQKYLPFIFQTDHFWKFAEENKKGSTNFFLNWSDFEKYEFNLPSIEKQKKLVDLLWSFQETKSAYKVMLEKTDEMVKSQFIEMFGDPTLNTKKLDVRPLGEISRSRLGKMLDKKQQTGQFLFPYLANYNVQWFELDLTSLNQMDFNEAEQREFELQEGDLLVCEGGVVGRCAVWHGEMEKIFFQKAIHRVRCNTEIILPEYLMWNFKIHSDYNAFSDIVGNSTIAHLPGIKLKKIKIPIPKMDDQLRFVELLQQSDKSKFELKQGISDMDALIKAFMVQVNAES